MRLFIERQGKSGNRKITRNNRRFSVERPDPDRNFGQVCRLSAIERDQRRVGLRLIDEVDEAMADGGFTPVCPYTGLVIPTGGGVLSCDGDEGTLELLYDHTGKLLSATTR